MKRSEMAKKLEAYIHKEFSLYDGLLNQANGMLQFLEDQGMRLCHPLFHGMVLAWDPEEELKPTQLTPEGAEQLKNGYLMIQADSGHWYARAPNGDESTIHWSKLAIRKWIRAHVSKDKRGKK